MLKRIKKKKKLNDSKKYKIQNINEKKMKIYDQNFKKTRFFFF